MRTEQAPKCIRFVEIFSGEVREVPFDQVPEENRWVFLHQGKIVETREEADEIVPVVEVRRMTLDAKGNLVAPKSAVTVRIEELGPGGRPLRWTSMERQSN